MKLFYMDICNKIIGDRPNESAGLISIGAADQDDLKSRITFEFVKHMDRIGDDFSMVNRQKS